MSWELKKESQKENGLKSLDRFGGLDNGRKNGLKWAIVKTY